MLVTRNLLLKLLLGITAHDNSRSAATERLGPKRGHSEPSPVLIELPGLSAGKHNLLVAIWWLMRLGNTRRGSTGDRINSYLNKSFRSLVIFFFLSGNNSLSSWTL